jgi:hypothetical protein
MTSRSEEDEFLRVAFAAIPRITEMIAALPAEHRAGALEVARRRYMLAAQDFGCTTADAERSVDVVMRELHTNGAASDFARQIGKLAPEAHWRNTTLKG